MHLALYLCLLTVFAGLPIAASADPPAGKLDGKVVDRIDAYVRGSLRRSHTPGASIAVVHEGIVILAKGYGLANVELGVEATKDTVYELLSVSKQFTAAATLML